MLTTAQLTTLKSDINGQGSLAAARAGADWPAVAAFYNANSAVQVWRPSVPKSELDAVANWTAFGAQTAIKQNIYFALTDPLNASSQTIRSAFAQVWTVAADQNALLAIAQRVATRLEALFVANAGPPITSAVFGYVINGDEIQKAMA